MDHTVSIKTIIDPNDQETTLYIVVQSENKRNKKLKVDFLFSLLLSEMFFEIFL